MRPGIALIENVDALLRRGLDVVLADLRSIGYHLEWDIIPAAAVGAPHLRQRFFGVARSAELAADPVYGDVLYDRHGERVTFELTGKLPRAGRMGAENVALEPIAPRKTKRHDGWSHWVGVDLLSSRSETALWGTPNAHPRTHTPRHVHHGEQLANQISEVESGSRLFPTATDAKGSRNETSRRTNPDSKHHSGHTLNDVVRLWPTPQKVDGDGGRVESSLSPLRPSGSKRSISLSSAIVLKGSALLPTPTANDDGKTPEAHMAMKSRLPGGARKTITSLAVLSRNGFEQPESGLWPTATARLGESRGAQAKRFLDPARSNDLDDAVAYRTIKSRGSLSPTWTEHIMAMPLYWTDPDFSNELVVPVPWWFEPPGVPRVEVGVRYRADRLRAIGNSVVYPCAYVALDRALAATPLRSVAFAA